MMAPASALIVAGEASGDLHAAALVRNVSQQYPVTWFGLGGDALADAGVELVEHARAVTVLGLFEVLAHLPRIYRVFRKLLTEVDRRKPRLAVLVDFPDFNLRLARQLHRRGIQVVYFIAPQIWAWRSGRLRSFQRYVRKVLCIFPFEEDIYQRARVEVEYVGHPLVDRAAPTMTREQFCLQYHLDPRRPLVCLLPGSRNQEVVRHLPVLLAAARRLQEKHPVQFVLVRASTVEKELIERHLRGDVEIRRVEGPVQNAMAASQVAVVSSGTATVEAALVETPFVVIYRVARLTWWLGRPLVRTPYYSMVNLIAERRVVPELVQNEFTPTRVAEEVNRLLEDANARETMKRELRAIRARLGPPGAIERASRAVLSLLGQPTATPVQP
ncbi:MAG: lipid-A-disaccharide synthase [Acidobacteria bacterium]|nr:lipid-A-disaccharide synthase [Acidobacteriota bacterium]